MHEVRTERALYDYVSELKSRFMRSAPPLAKVVYDPTLHIVRDALGTHSAVLRVQGAVSRPSAKSAWPRCSRRRRRPSCA